MNPYEILNVPEDATDKEIKKAFRDLSKEHHPDKEGSAEAFDEIKQAYELIKDESARNMFDYFGSIPMKDVYDRAMDVFMEAFRVSGLYHGKALQEVIDSVTDDSVENGEYKLRDIERQIEKLTDLQAKIKKAPAKDFIMERLVNSIDQLNRSKEAHEAAIKLAKGIKVLLSEYDFEDKEHPLEMSGFLRSSI